MKPHSFAPFAEVLPPFDGRNKVRNASNGHPSLPRRHRRPAEENKGFSLIFQPFTLTLHQY